MTDATVAILIHGIGMLAMIVAGAIQVHFGYRTYLAKSQLGPTNSTLRWGRLGCLQTPLALL